MKNWQEYNGVIALPRDGHTFGIYANRHTKSPIAVSTGDGKHVVSGPVLLGGGNTYYRDLITATLTNMISLDGLLQLVNGAWQGPHWHPEQSQAQVNYLRHLNELLDDE